MVWTNVSLGELPELARLILSTTKTSAVYLLEGAMGAGKTELVSHFLKALGSADSVQSPSFGLVHEYKSPVGPIFHFDFYRIENEDEALDMGLEEYLDSGQFCFIEWPEMIARLLPDKFNRIQITNLDGNSRKIELLPAS